VIYSAPSVKPGAHFVYFDPIDLLGPEAQARWQNASIAEEMIAEAVAKAGGLPTYVNA